MELRHLRYFRAVAKELHLTRAAGRLGIAQPPLTQQIKALEAEVGTALFRRAGRGIALTEAGKVFLEDVLVVLSHVNSVVTRAQRVGRGEIGPLRLGFTESASFNPVVSRLLVQFRAAWPEIVLTLTEGQSTVLAGQLRRGELDGAFVRPPLPDPASFDLLYLAEETLLAAVPANHPLAGRAEIDLSELAGEAFVLYPRENSAGLSDAIVAACLTAGFQPRVVQRTPQLSSTVNLVAAALGVAIVPACMRHLRAESVSFLPLRGKLPVASISFAMRAGEETPAIQNLAQLVERAGTAAPTSASGKSA